MRTHHRFGIILLLGSAALCRPASAQSAPRTLGRPTVHIAATAQHRALIPSAPRTRVNLRDGAVMIWIPAGKFQMGDDDMATTVNGAAVYNPRHTVTLSGFWMYKNLVTVDEYKKFCSATNRQMPPSPSFDANWSQGDHPIVDVNWNDATAYSAWAGVKLPTEAQWEKAARGTDGRKYPWGNTFDVSKLWCSKSAFGDAGGTTAVGHYGVSPYGCTDMAGNAWEWCEDWYSTSFWTGRAAEVTDPVNAHSSSISRVCRGGAWANIEPMVFRAAHRSYNQPGGNGYIYGKYIGFRCASRADSP